MSSPLPEDNVNITDDEGDLFGDDADNGSEPERALSDRELDSGDDEGRNDRRREGSEEQEPVETYAARFTSKLIARHPFPQSSDGEINSLRMPKFVGIAPRQYDPSTFEIPTTDHHSDTKSEKFSASITAASTIRYRKRSDGKLDSNTLMHKWSDGSVTVQIGDQHYELQHKPLAQPRDAKTYQDVLDSHQYLASPHMQSELLMLIGHMSKELSFRPSGIQQDDALERLQNNLAAAARGRNKDNKDGIAVITNNQDPELQKKEAEMAEKERMKAQRRREAAAARTDQATGRIGRSVMGGGLSIGDLEDGGGRRAPASGRKPRPRAPASKRARHNYDSDEDDMPRGRNREDEYDLDDGFLAGSDEEIEEDDEDEEEEEEILEDEEPRHKKRKASRADSVSDADADAELDDGALGEAAEDATVARGKRRNIIEDDEDDDE